MQERMLERLDQLIKKYEKSKNNTPQESTDWNDFWKNQLEEAGAIKKSSSRKSK